jgi:LPS sulfotransferase NodH
MKTKSLYLRPFVNRFAILFVGRTGSTYLQELLDSHPNIRCLGEALPELKDRGATSQLQWVEWALTPPLIGPYRALGFKTKLSDVLDHKGFGQTLKRNQVKIIHLQRRNRIKAAVSYFNVRRVWEKTGEWGLYDEKDRPDLVYIDPLEFDQALKRREEYERVLGDFVNQIDLPLISMDYDDLLLQRDKALLMIYDYLRVKPKPVFTNAKKITTDNLRNAFLNYDELRSHYVGTPYESMFDETLNHR